MTIKQDFFGHTASGDTVSRYTLANKLGTTISILNLGGIVQSIKTTDRNGRLGDIVLGCDSVSDYEQQSAYLGALCGRYANRIRNGQFYLDGEQYQLVCNSGHHHLHGGPSGYSHRLWSVEPTEGNSESKLVLRYVSRDGEEGYPGQLTIQVTYRLTASNEFIIDYRAITNKTTVVNLTNHAYFNLRGYGSCLGHKLQLFADHYLPTDQTAIPTGKIIPVHATPMDFRQSKKIGDEIFACDPQLKIARGYDHNWVLNQSPSALKMAALVEEPESGRTLLVKTTHPGVQMYTGNYLEGTAARSGGCYQNHDGFCLETQHFPDSPNHPQFPTTTLQAGDTYHQTTVFVFGTC